MGFIVWTPMDDFTPTNFQGNSDALPTKI